MTAVGGWEWVTKKEGFRGQVFGLIFISYFTLIYARFATNEETAIAINSSIQSQETMQNNNEKVLELIGFAKLFVCLAVQWSGVHNCTHNSTSTNLSSNWLES